MNGEQSTLWPAESLASLSVWPGSRQAQQMTVTSGQRLLEYSRLCGPVGSVLRTLAVSSAWRSMTCLLTWKHKVTPQGRSYYQLQVSVPPIDGIVSGWWRTPNTMDSLVPKSQEALEHEMEHRPGAMEPNNLRDQLAVRMGMRYWPTPTADDASNVTRESGQFQSLTLAVMFPTPNAANAGNDLTLTCSGDGREKPNKLGCATAQRMWMTPKARDADFGTPSTSGRSREMSTHLGTQVAAIEGLLPTPQVSVGRNNTAQRSNPDSTHHAGETIYDLAYREGGKLNPAWISRMMGFPDGWMDVGEEIP